MANQTGIAIVIKAFLPTGKSLDEQFAALSIVKDAHASGDYTALLQAARVEEVKTEQKTRRIEERLPGVVGAIGLPAADATEQAAAAAAAEDAAAKVNASEKEADDAEVPAFLKKDAAKKKAA